MSVAAHGEVSNVLTRSTIVEHTRELLRVGGARLLDADLDRLDEASIDNAARSLLCAFREAYGGNTLRALLTDPYFPTWVDESCSGSDQDALVHQLRVWIGIRIAHGGGVDDPARLVAIERVPKEYVKLLRWAEQHKVLEELQRPAEDLAGDRPELTAGLSLLEAALQPGELQCTALDFSKTRLRPVKGLRRGAAYGCTLGPARRYDCSVCVYERSSERCHSARSSVGALSRRNP